MTRLQFGSLAIDPPLLLAPMAGISHSPFRRLLAEQGGVGLFATEMLSARRLPAENPRLSPFLIRTAAEHPLCYQLLIADPREAAPALAALAPANPQAIDINLGCPAPLVRRRGGGSRLMQEPERARAVVAAVRRATTLPLSAKIRLGERLDEKFLVEFCRLLEGEGVDLITVHARLRGEPYGRTPRWRWIGAVKEAVAVPVVGNGGIFSAQDARRCRDASGCDGFMVGRGAVVRPWLLNELAAWLAGGPTPPRPARPALFFRFLSHLEQGFAMERRLGRLKEFTHHFSQTYPFGHTLSSAVQSSATIEQAHSRARAFFLANDPAGLEACG